MFFQDETDDPYPVDGTLEEKALYGLEQVRASYFNARVNYDENKTGGPRHLANVMTHGQAIADSIATQSEESFKAFLKNAMLNEDGETTDPRYPTDKMINRELRRMRAVVIQMVSQYMYRFSQMMADTVSGWSEVIIGFNLMPFVNKYNNVVYSELASRIPKRNIKPRSTADVAGFVSMMSFKYSNPNFTAGLNKEYLIDRLKDELIDFILLDIPYNNTRLNQKTELIADEKGKKKTDPPVLH